MLVQNQVALLIQYIHTKPDFHLTELVYYITAIIAILKSYNYRLLSSLNNSHKHDL